MGIILEGAQVGRSTLALRRTLRIVLKSEALSRAQFARISAVSLARERASDLHFGFVEFHCPVACLGYAP